jgi:methionine-rich copper-binding protein CopC
MKRAAWLAILATLLCAGPVHAHPQLDKAIPAVGSTIAASPPEIRIFFTQALNPTQSNIDVAADSGAPITTGRAAVDSANPMQMVLKMPPLAPGKYRVHWHVASTDGHELDGRYAFEVGR